MSNTYNRGNTFVKYLNVLRLNGTVPDVLEYTVPTYSILFKDGVFATIVADVALVQGEDNAWYFSYSIPNDADLGTYLIKYKFTINGVSVEGTEDYIVALPADSESGPGTGEFEITDEVQSDSMVDLSGVDVFVFLTTDTDNAIAHATTDSSGEFTVYLDAGSYLVMFNKAGFISETHNMTVDGSGGHSFTGD